MIRFEDLRVRDRDIIDRDFLNKRYRLIAESLVSIGQDVDGLRTDSDSLVALGLSRIDDVLGPALATVTAAAETGFLSASSSTPLTMSVGLQTTFQITTESERALFAPTPHVVITRAGSTSYNDWAILRVDSYHRQNGGLAGEVIAINGAIGASAYSDWIISASAGIAASILDFAVQAADTLAAAQAAEQTATEAATTIETIMEDGPVSSVNGQSGEVDLGITDIPNLLTTLNAKALATHGHQIGDVQDLQTALNGKSATGHGHQVADVTGLQTALDGKGEITGVTAGTGLAGGGTTGGVTLDIDGTVATLTGAQTLTNKSLTSPSLTGNTSIVELTETVHHLTGASIDPANGTIQYKTLTANTAFTESLADGQSVLLRLAAGASYTVTWFTVIWVGGAPPTLTANDYLVFWQEGATVYGNYLGSVV